MASMGRWSRLWVDDFDLSTKTASAEINKTIGTAEVTVFQSSGKEFVTTEPEGNISITGYVDALAAGAGGLEQELSERFAAANTALVGLLLSDTATGDAGMPCYVLPATAVDTLNITAPATGVLGVDGSFMAGDAGLRRGLCLWYGAVTATGNKPAIDFGAAGSAGGDVYVWVLAISGAASNANVKVQSATSSGGTYSDEAAITFSARGGYAAAMTGSVSQFLRLNVAGMGGATSITLAVVAAVDGVTQPV